MGKRASTPGDHLREVRVRGFRGIDRLDLAGLTPVTLLTGRNNVGKSTLLEALFLASAPMNPGLTVSVNFSRGILNVPQLDVHLNWAWLFNQVSATDSFSIETRRGIGRAQARGRMEVRMSESLRNLTLRSLGEPSGSIAGASIARDVHGAPRQLEIVYVVGRTRHRVVVEAREEGLRAVEGTMGNLPGQRLCQLLSLDGFAASPSLSAFTRVVNEGRAQDLVDGLRTIEPRLKALEILEFGGNSMLHADIGVGRRIPLTLMGHGLSDAARILLAVENVRGGLLLIDEVGAGLHHTVLRGFWSALIPFARACGVQIVGTTHSRECLDAAAAADQAGPRDDVSLIRLDRTEEGLDAVHYTESELLEAARRGFEVR